PTGSYDCTFIAQVTGAGSKTDVVTASGIDDDGFPVQDDAAATVLVVGCGDGIVEPDRGEQCDDGNSQFGDGCTPTCTIEDQTTPVCTHSCASKIVKTPGTRPDLLTLRVGWVPSDPSFSPPQHEFGVMLVNSHGSIWEGRLLPGDFVQSGRRWIFKDQTATLRDGITQAIITFKPDGIWRLDIRVKTDLTAATEPVMAVAVLTGNQTFVISAQWKRTASGWRVFMSQ
ncbi:MAG TPA: myxococcus cysteine-rich repeat containing protein, partial [Candidatus Binatia bacterium]|nr:myxococcus cysteine-rich repeat containing protein [Candidatus Binatia bacterium]